MMSLNEAFAPGGRDISRHLISVEKMLVPLREQASKQAGSLEMSIYRVHGADGDDPLSRPSVQCLNAPRATFKSKRSVSYHEDNGWPVSSLGTKPMTELARPVPKTSPPGGPPKTMSCALQHFDCGIGTTFSASLTDEISWFPGAEPL